MKTIALLTDFSKQSEHAALYALHLAKKINAGLIVYSIDPLPACQKLVSAWGLHDDDEPELRSEINEQLEAFISGLHGGLIERSFAGVQQPVVAFDRDNQGVVDVMTSIVNNESIVLMVIAPREGEDIATCVLSDRCRQIADWAPVPLMVVPGTAPIRNPEKIAITTDLGKAETDYINAVAKLVNQFSPEIMVAHLSEGHKLQDIFTPLEKELMASLYKKVDYGRIYYRRVLFGGKEKPWKWLIENKKCDLLAIKHQPKKAMREFFNLGLTPQITHHITIPIIVLPEIG